jgi:hypothetical protein
MAQDPLSRVAAWITQPKADLAPMIALSREWTAIEQGIIAAEEADDQARLSEHTAAGTADKTLRAAARNGGPEDGEPGVR